MLLNNYQLIKTASAPQTAVFSRTFRTLTLLLTAALMEKLPNLLRKHFCR